MKPANKCLLLWQREYFWFSGSCCADLWMTACAYLLATLSIWTSPSSSHWRSWKTCTNEPHRAADRPVLHFRVRLPCRRSPSVRFIGWHRYGTHTYEVHMKWQYSRCCKETWTCVYSEGDILSPYRWANTDTVFTSDLKCCDSWDEEAFDKCLFPHFHDYCGIIFITQWSCVIGTTPCNSTVYGQNTCLVFGMPGSSWPIWCVLAQQPHWV